MLNLVFTQHDTKVTLKLIDTNDDGKYNSASILDNNDIIINNAKINFIIKSDENNSSFNQLLELPQSFFYQLIDFKSNTLNIYSENFTKL